ncbi:MAG: 2TM domain-containing protein [Chitinophagaceae bacterium]|nr:2TM domain-containing protein [Chitinophagaceae bacterium]
MTNSTAAPEGKDPVLWELAQKRAGFKKHAVTYVIINLFLWCVWYFTTDQHTGFRHHYP